MFIADPLPITIRSYSFIRVDATSKQISVWRLALGSPIDWDGRAIVHSYEETRQALLGRRRMEEPLNLALNLMGTFAFGLSGGILAVKKRMDLFGVLVLTVSTGLGGGSGTGVIFGHTPPANPAGWGDLGTAR